MELGKSVRLKISTSINQIYPIIYHSAKPLVDESIWRIIDVIVWDGIVVEVNNNINGIR